MSQHHRLNLPRCLPFLFPCVQRSLHRCRESQICPAQCQFQFQSQRQWQTQKLGRRCIKRRWWLGVADISLGRLPVHCQETAEARWSVELASWLSVPCQEQKDWLQEVDERQPSDAGKLHIGSELLESLVHLRSQGDTPMNALGLHSASLGLSAP